MSFIKAKKIKTDLTFYSENGDDIFDRLPIAKNLTEIIKNDEGGFVMALDSAWGGGKSTFIMKWKNLLPEEEFIPLYFNAWENDDSEDPLAALLMQFESLIIERKTEEENNEDKRNEKIGKIKKVGFSLLKKGLPLAVKIATQGLVSVEGVNLGEFNEKEIVNFSSKLGEIDYKAQKIEIDKKEKFIDALIDFQREENKKIIFFIDELDRCRPSFAIELLERIKHLFHQQDYYFIISVDKSEMSESIKNVYGNINSHNYLKKFFDFEYTLPKPTVEKYMEFLITKLSNEKYKKDFYLWIKMIIEQLPETTLRDCEKIFNYTIFIPKEVIESSIKSRLIAYFVVLKVVN